MATSEDIKLAIDTDLVRRSLAALAACGLSILRCSHDPSGLPT